jgi:DNA-binding protein HU-beta
VSATLEALKDALAKGEKVQLIGFGTFDVVERAARTGINPQTKKKMQIPAKKAVRFRAGKPLKDAVA